MLLNNSLVNHLEKFSQFSDFQDDFMSSRLIVDLLTAVGDRIATALDMARLKHLINQLFLINFGMLVFSNMNLTEFPSSFHPLWTPSPPCCSQEGPINLSLYVHPSICLKPV